MINIFVNLFKYIIVNVYVFLLIIVKIRFFIYNYNSKLVKKIIHISKLIFIPNIKYYSIESDNSFKSNIYCVMNK